MKKIIMRLLIIMAIISISQAQNLSLREAFEIVLLNNDSLKASHSSIQKAQKFSQATKMLYAPNIDLLANYTYIDEPIKLGMPSIPNLPIPLPHIKLSTNNITYGILNITYPLFVGGKRIYANNIANLNIDDANYILNLKKLNLFEELVKTYYGLILNLDILKTLKDIQNNHKIHLEHAIKLEKEGQIAKIELLNAQVQYDKAKNKTLQALDTAQVALLAFKNILQDSSIDMVEINEQDSLTNLNLTSKLDISERSLDDLDSYKQKILASYPMLNSIKVKKQQAHELSKIELANFFPTIGLYGGYVFKDNNVLINKAVPNWYIGIGAKLSILSASGTIFKYQASKIAQKEVDYTLSQARKDILLLTEKTYKEALFAKESFENLTSTLELAQENLKLQEEAFNNGMNDSTKVNDAINTLSGAIIEQKNAKYRYIIALSKLYALSNDIEAFYHFY